MSAYGIVIVASWAAFILVWGIGAFNVKRDIRGGGFAAAWRRFFVLRLLIGAAAIFVASRILESNGQYTNFGPNFLRTLYTPPTILGWLAAALSVTGIAFAIWARVYLGRNWSAAPAVKEGHELVTSGPYAYVRHPIYSGFLLAGAGAALIGSIFGIGVLAIIALIFISRIGREERIMLELFPDAYPKYQARTKRLIPFIW
jgi:protein-S-isoprenylcysteine O-methyltransferase Ste14